MLPSNVLEWLWHQLEFNYTDLTRVYREVVECLEQISSLRPRTDVYTTEQGHSDLLLVLFGPLAANINGVTYGIPVEIWIPKQYPIGSPIVWVRPTPDMRVNPGSRVDGNGRVYFDWEQQYTLTGLCSELSHTFGLECPVYSAPTPASQQQPAAPPAVPEPPRQHTRHVVTNIMDSDDTPVPALPARSSETSNLHDILTQTVANIKENEVQMDLKSLDNTTEVLEWVSSCLDKEKTQLGQSLETAKSSIRVLDDTIKQARTKIAECHAPKYQLYTVDEMVKPKSKPAQQLLDAMARDAALGDIIKALPGKYASDIIELDTMLKTTRSLARRQFKERHKADCARLALSDVSLGMDRLSLGVRG